MQVILGAGGAIGTELAKELKHYTEKIRLVGRNPVRVNEDDELFSGDLTQQQAVERAVEGAELVYLTAGVPYKTKTWQNNWPLMMKNVISACKKQKAKLVFFDNIYMYNPGQLNPMTEETEIYPVSEKGKVRSEISGMLLHEIQAGTVQALIARSADFYGPRVKNSILNEAVINNLKKGKKANWFCSLDKLHNFTFTPDAAKATALLGNTENAFGQVWHLPTASPITGKQWIEKIAAALKVEPQVRVVSKKMIKVLGLFNPIMKEFNEMMYQFDRDYDFDSSKFETVFKSVPTTIEKGIEQILNTG